MNQPQTSNESQRPLITFALFTYNQEQFIAEAVQGALDQTYSPLEIILSDDYSTDQTFAIMQKLTSEYTGPHQVIVRQNKKNIGWVAHINHVMGMVKGEFVVVAAGDDISLPNRVLKTYKTYIDSGKQAQSIFANALIVKETGGYGEFYFPENGKRAEELTVEWMAKHLSGVLGCTQAWSPEVFAFFGPLDPKVYQEDLIIPFRAGLLGEVIYIDDILVQYRQHDTNMHLRSVHDKRVASELNANLLKQALNQVAVCENRIQDLKKVYTVFPEQSARWDELRRLITKRKNLSGIEITLYQSDSLTQRLNIIIKAWYQHHVPIRVIVRWCLTLFPIMFIWYQKYLRFRNRRTHKSN